MEPVSTKTFYHVTLSCNLRVILSQGLAPTCGDRKHAACNTPCVYLFGCRDDAEDAVIEWLGEEFTECLTLLEIILPADFILDQEAFEYICRTTIPPGCITVVGEV